MDDEVKLKSLGKAIEVLECFTPQKPEQGITEISQKLGFYKSNVHNILSTLEKKGYIQRNHDTGKYRLGLKILDLGHVVSTNIGFREIILPYMQEVSRETGETSYLGIPGDGDVVYLESCSAPNLLPARNMLGLRAPMYCTGIGKAMLAYLPEEKARQVLECEFTRFTENTIVDSIALRKEMEAIRERGYAIDNMEHEFGIKCIGMPIFKNGCIVAGLSVSGPSLRFDSGRMVYYAEVLKKSTISIQKRL